jgi:hypothetical protein
MNKRSHFLFALIALSIAMLACIIGDSYPPTVTSTPDWSASIQADIYATIYIYDASLGEDYPIAGARHSLCDTPTSDYGVATCPWLTGPIPRDWWEENAESGRRVEISIHAEGYEPITVVRYGWQTSSPEFKIGLLPQGISTPANIFFNLTASLNWSPEMYVREGEQIVIEVLRGSWGAWGGPGGCYNRANGLSGVRPNANFHLSRMQP